jgi:hypothetical protein
MRLRSPSPGRGSGSERELLLSPKTLLEEPDLESGSDSEDKPDSSSPASVWSYASRSPAVAGLLRGVLLGVLAIGWMKIFHDKICGVVSNCGCTWPWAGGWKKCNIHNHDGPRCPWCVASAASKLLDVVSQKSAPLSIVCVHLIQEHMFPFGGKPATEEQHRLQLFCTSMRMRLSKNAPKSPKSKKKKKRQGTRVWHPEACADGRPPAARQARLDGPEPPTSGAGPTAPPAVFLQRRQQQRQQRQQQQRRQQQQTPRHQRHRGLQHRAR